MNQATESLIPLPAYPTRPLPIAREVRSGFSIGYMPMVFHPERRFECAQFERFPHKIKRTPDEAMAYADRVIWHRNRRKAGTKRRVEAVAHPNFFGRAA